MLNEFTAMINSLAYYQGLLATACLATTLIPASVSADQADQRHQVTIYRDTWGVPHVYAETEAAGAYGLGYAQAEDRLGDIYQAVRTGMGSMSEAFGPEHVQQDYAMRLWKNAELAEGRWDELPEQLREICTAFVQGIQAYQASHPEQVPDYAMELEPWMMLTIGRAMTLQWPIGTILSDLKGSPQSRPRLAPAQRSNQWAVAPSRSADNVPILLTDPHLKWEGLAVLYEAARSRWRPAHERLLLDRIPVGRNRAQPTRWLGDDDRRSGHIRCLRNEDSRFPKATI